ncbi:MAG: HDIG domain-containing protein [Muribaculaceae bacterium]|nr:HDIG domain-containing protein [Muribaculaceae bacterium]
MFKKIFSRNNILRGILFIASVVIISYFLPRTDKFEYEYEMGKPWSYSLLTAPFDIPINLDTASIKHLKDSIDANFISIYKRDNAATSSRLTNLWAKLADVVAPHTNKLLLYTDVKNIYDNGIVDNSTYQRVLEGKLPHIKFVVENVTKLYPTDNIVSVKAAYTKLDSMHISNSVLMRDAEIAEFLVPNIVIDQTLSKKMLDAAYQKVLAPIGLLQKGERIVDRGEKISIQTFTILQTYERMMTDRHKTREESHYPLVGQLLVVTILIASMYVFLSMFRWRFFNDMRKMTFLMLLFTAFTVFAFLISKHTTNGIYVIPFAMIPLIFTIFFDSRTAMFIHISEVFVCTLVATFPLEFVFLQFVAGVTAINSLKELSKRAQLIQCAFFIFLAYSITYIALDIIKVGNIESLNYRYFAYFGVNAVLLSFTYVFIFIIEKMFGFISTVTLVELSDVNNKLLRELSEECPGTFQHSLQVANLAAEAARKVNANVQLVRAGALYHDIGKLSNPAFFTENQHGVNPHEPITPEQSAKIVINHVYDGLKLAEKEKLPGVIREFISQHHGRGKAKFFYTIACNNSETGDVDVAQFTYPGPNPQTKETAIMMMADATEAASRSLTDHTEKSITDLVNKIINSQISDGLLEDSPLSFRDVNLIKQTFVDRLKTIYHTRISYPELNK